MRRVPRKLAAGLIVTLGALACSSAPALATEGYGITSTFGAASSTPSDPYPLSNPSSVAVDDTSKDVYVVDSANNRVEYFSSTGTYIGRFNGTEINGVRAGAGKEAPSNLSDPTDIAVDNCAHGSTPCTKTEDPSVGDVYVAEPNQGLVDKFSATGEFLFQLKILHGFDVIATDPSDGDLWVLSEPFDAEVQEFSDAVENESKTPVNFKFGFLDGGFAVDSEGNLYIGHGGVSGVVKLSKTGTEFGEPCRCYGARGLAIDPASNDLFVLLDGGTSIAQYGPFGEPFGAPPIGESRPNVLVEGYGIAVLGSDVYVASYASKDVAIFTLGPTPEVPVTGPASAVTSTTAVLHGEVKMQAPATRLEYYFEYNAGAHCAGGSQTPVKVKEGEGEVSEEITGLEPRAGYTYCLVTGNNFGFTTGNGMPLETLSAPPEVISESASNHNTVRSEFAAVINPNHSAQETTCSFEYSTEGSTADDTLEGAVETIGCEYSIPAEAFQPEPVNSERVALIRLATYYYRVVVTSECEPGKTCTTVGKVQSYTKLPIVGGESASGLTLSSATLEASINQDFQFTSYEFEYSDSKEALEKGEGTKVPGAAKIEENFEPVTPPGEPVSVAIDGLEPYTVYYYRVVAENEASENPNNINEGQPVRGKIEAFTTRSVPLVSTGEASNITRTTAALVGTVTPPFVNATYYFEYIANKNYQAALAKGAENPYAESEKTSPIAIAPSQAASPVGPISADGLLPAEIYHYRLVSKNEFGLGYGEDHTFTTLAGTPPIVATGGASSISQNAATISGTVDTNSLQTEYGFEIGTEPGNYGPATGLGSIGGALTESVTLTLGELQPGTTYSYRVTATNADGTVHGEPQSFTTPGFPALLSTPSSLPLVAVPSIAFPTGGQGNTGASTETKAITSAQRLTKALAACRADKKRSKRTKCEKQARVRYAKAKKRRM
jgi:hypothetical protein